jgi:hypothetical protein
MPEPQPGDEDRRRNPSSPTTARSSGPQSIGRLVSLIVEDAKRARCKQDEGDDDKQRQDNHYSRPSYWSSKS